MPAPTPIQLVVFDIGNVLIEWEPERFYDTVIGRDRREALFAAVDLLGMNLDIDRGADFRGTVYATASRHPEWQDEIRMWHDRWSEMATPAIDHSVRLMRALRANGVPVHALSNFGTGSFEVAAGIYDFLNEFDARHISGHLEVIKPDARIYEIAEAHSGLAPGAILFTDDRPENISAAQARGWHTHLFDGAQGLANRLVAERLLSRDQAA